MFSKPIGIKQGIIVFLLAGGVGLLAGCDLAPSSRAAEEAVRAVVRAFEASYLDREVQVERPFQNVMDKAYFTGDATVSHTLRIIFNQDQSKSVSGTCVFSGYRDTDSGLGMGGEFSYKASFYAERNAQLEFTCNVALTGSDVKRLTIDALGTPRDGAESYTLKINDEDYRLKYWRKLLEIDWRFLLAAGRTSSLKPSAGSLGQAFKMQN